MLEALKLSLRDFVELISLVIDFTGVLVILVGVVIATLRFFTTHAKNASGYTGFRQDLGRGILLGLEFLVAGDIIHTVAVEPTLEGVVVLGIIVLVRTFLSMALQVELEGRWPWQQASQAHSSAHEPAQA